MHRSKVLRRTLVARYTQERASLIEIACESSSGYPALVPYGRHYAVRPPRDELARLIQATPTNGATSRGAAVSSMMRSRLCTPSRQDMDGQDLDASKANSISAPAHGFTHPGKGRPPERRSVRLVASSGSSSSLRAIAAAALSSLGRRHITTWMRFLASLDALRGAGQSPRPRPRPHCATGSPAACATRLAKVIGSRKGVRPSNSGQLRFLRLRSDAGPNPCVEREGGAEFQTGDRLWRKFVRCAAQYYAAPQKPEFKSISPVELFFGFQHCRTAWRPFLFFGNIGEAVREALHE